MINSGNRFAVGIDCSTCVTQTVSPLPSSQAASMLHSPEFSRIKYPVCTPAFSIKICINERSNCSSSISREIAWDALITAAKSKSLPERLELVSEGREIDVGATLDGWEKNCG